MPASLSSLLTMSESHHHRRSSSPSSPQSPRSPSPPSQTYHRSILTMPTPALLESAAGGAHYSGVKVDSETLLKHRRNSSFKQHTEIEHCHQRILEDLTELYCGRPTREIFERSWHRDAEFEVHTLSIIYQKVWGNHRTSRIRFPSVKALMNTQHK